MDTKTIEAVMKTVTIDTKIDGGKIDAVIGERARMDVERAVYYIKSGEEEIKKAVREGRAELDTEGQKYVDLAKDWAIKTDGTVDGSEYSSKYWAEQILPLSDDIATVVGIASDVSAVGAVASDVSTVASDLTNINTVAGISSDVSAVGGISSDVTSVASNSSDISAVADDIASVVAVADDIASVVAVAGDLTNIDNASTYAAEAKQWAIGDPTEPTGNSAKYWAEEASSTLGSLTARVEDIEEVIPSDASDTNQLADKSYVDTADNGLQNQIDALVVASDVFDIVGTYAELQAYDISTVPVNDIIKVLVDSTHSGAATYYRCVETGGVKSWSYIGSEGAYYTKSEADNKFVPQTRTINSKALSSNIALTASDVGALQSGDNVSELVNDAGYTTNIGTVTSVNGNLPDASGAVTVSGLTVDQTYDGTSTNAQSGTAIAGLLEAIYPVGSVYIGTQATCPMSTVMSGTTWTLVAKDKALWTGDGTNGNTTIAAGLPNITGTAQVAPGRAGYVANGAFSQHTTENATNVYASGTQSTRTQYGIGFNASNSNSIYGNSTTVQPPAYVVNVWRRTA